MSMTVRFSTGLAVTFNTANWLRGLTGGQGDLYTRDPDKGGRWLARIPADAILEAVSPCVVNMQGQSDGDLLDEVIARVRGMSLLDGVGGQLADLKRSLRGFDARDLTWKR